MTRFRLGVCLLLAIAAQSTWAASGTMAKVRAVVDGSTLRVEVRGRESLVHLMGVATPPVDDDSKPVLKQLGLEATAFLKEATKSDWVYIEYPAGDQPSTPDAPLDVAMYCGNDSALVNEKLVREGFGIVNRKVSSPLNEQLIKAEETARASSNGIWGGFAHGDGQAVASGKAKQGTFIGNVDQRAPAPRYVRIWIISFR